MGPQYDEQGRLTGTFAIASGTLVSDMMFHLTPGTGRIESFVDALAPGGSLSVGYGYQSNCDLLGATITIQGGEERLRVLRSHDDAGRLTMIVTQARSALLAATMFLVPCGAFADIESPWSLPRDVRISDGMAAPAGEMKWKGAMQLKLPDFESATGVRLLSKGEAETVAVKFRRLQDAVAKLSNGRQTLPVFIDPNVALQIVPASETDRLGSPLRGVPVEEAIKLMCERFSLRHKLTDNGILVFR